tara:strand:- start:717 stop:1094 length:378 start_codon:yes stop_codon:yes gene_type:complete
MNLKMTNNNYGNFLSQYKWNYLATIRPNYKLNEVRAEKLAKNLMSNWEVKKLFYAVEKDMGDDWYHMHLILDAVNVTKKNLAEYIGWNDTKVIGYLEKIENKEAVTHYIAKRIGKSALCHNFLIK